MKKYICIMLMLILPLLLGGCSGDAGSNEHFDISYTSLPSPVTITDKETGVVYLAYNHGLVVMRNPDGSILVDEDYISKED